MTTPNDPRPKRTHYEVLGVDKSASQEDIHKAYRRKASELHSDKPENAGIDPALMAEVNVAYGILSDEAKRAYYDQTGLDNLNSEEHQAHQLFMEKALNWLKQNNNAAMEGNLIGDVVSQLLSEREGIAIKKARCIAILSNIQRARKKLKYKGKGKSLLHLALEEQESLMRRDIEQGEAVVKRIALAIDIAKDYEYESAQGVYSPTGTQFLGQGMYRRQISIGNVT